MSLHVIAGKFRSRVLKSPKGDATRPTTALLRKALFDILRDKIEGALFLDLFAGSGAMGLEALSRGALHATFIEKDREALRAIHDNIRHLQVEHQSSILSFDALTSLKQLEKQHKQFDIIYSDPPYPIVAIQLEILSFLDRGTLIKPGSVIFLEEGEPSKLEFSQLQRLKFYETRRFGKSLLHQFRPSFAS